MKVHLESNNKNLTVCGGRISGVKATRKKQFFAFGLQSFLNVPIKDRCTKCNLKVAQ